MGRSRFPKSCSRISARTRFPDRHRSRAGARARLRGRAVLAGEQIELAGIGGGGFLGGGKRELEAEPVREALAGFGRKPFEMIVHETPDAARFAQMPFDL